MKTKSGDKGNGEAVSSPLHSPVASSSKNVVIPGTSVVARRSANMQKAQDGSFIYKRRQSLPLPVSAATPESKGADPLVQTRSQGKETSRSRMSLLLDKRSDRKRPADSDASMSGSIPKRRRTILTKTDGTCIEADAFCWICHRDGTGICCELCPRLYHVKCLGIEEPDKEWICPECDKIMVAETMETRSKAMSMISMDTLCTLLKFVLQRMKYPETDAFQRPVDCAMIPTYTDYIFNSMDFSTLEKNIKKKLYGSTEAFVADVKWILHNCIVFNGKKHRLTSVAKTILKICRHETNEIEVCPDCYMNSCVKPSDNWFCEPCRSPHTLVWAKMKGYPFWPAKVLREDKGLIDVRFFGEHDRAWVPVSQIYLMSEEPPNSLKNRKGFENATEELHKHIALLRERNISFQYAPHRTLYDPNSPYSKVNPSTTNKAEELQPVVANEKIKIAKHVVKVKKEDESLAAKSLKIFISKIPEKPASIATRRASAVRLKYSSIISTRKNSVKKSESAVAATQKPSAVLDSCLEGNNTSEQGLKLENPKTEIGDDRSSDMNDEPALMETGEWLNSEQSDDKNPQVDDGDDKGSDKNDVERSVTMPSNDHSDPESKMDAEHSAQDDVGEERGESAMTGVGAGSGAVANGGADTGALEAESFTEPSVVEEDAGAADAGKTDSSPSVLTENLESVQVSTEVQRPGDSNCVENALPSTAPLTESDTSLVQNVLCSSPAAEDEPVHLTDDVQASSHDSGVEGEGQSACLSSESHESESSNSQTVTTVSNEFTEISAVQNDAKSAPVVDVPGVADGSAKSDAVQSLLEDGKELMDAEESSGDMISERPTPDHEPEQELDDPLHCRISAELIPSLEMLSSGAFLVQNKSGDVSGESADSNVQSGNSVLTTDAGAGASSGDALTSTVESIVPVDSDSVTKKTESVGMETDSVAVKTGTVGMETDTVGMETDTVGMETGTVVMETAAADVNATASGVDIVASDDIVAKLTTVISSYLQSGAPDDSAVAAVDPTTSTVAKPSSSEPLDTVSIMAESKQVSSAVVASQSEATVAPARTPSLINVSPQASTVSLDTTTSSVAETCTPVSMSRPTSQANGEDQITEDNSMVIVIDDDAEESVKSLKINDVKSLQPVKSFLSGTLAVEAHESSRATHSSASAEASPTLLSNASQPVMPRLTSPLQRVPHAIAVTTTPSTVLNIPRMAFSPLKCFTLATSRHTPHDSSRGLTSVSNAAVMVNQNNLSDAACSTLSKSDAHSTSFEFNIDGFDYNKYTNKIINSAHNMLKEFCQDMISAEPGSAVRRHMQLELERIQWKHEQELNEIKHNAAVQLAELRLALEHDKEHSLAELRQKLEDEKRKEIDEVKKKQWCANCGKEAIFYCCWNTSYCDYPCQQAHWPKHMNSCTQSVEGSQSTDDQSGSRSTANPTSSTQNKWKENMDLSINVALKQQQEWDRQMQMTFPVLQAGHQQYLSSASHSVPAAQIISSTVHNVHPPQPQPVMQVQYTAGATYSNLQVAPYLNNMQQAGSLLHQQQTQPYRLRALQQHQPGIIMYPSVPTTVLTARHGNQSVPIGSVQRASMYQPKNY